MPPSTPGAVARPVCPRGRPADVGSAVVARVNGLLADTTPLRISPPFRRLWWGLGISNLGSQLTVVAVGLQVYALTGSSLACACRTLKCAEPERIDRIMFRSSKTVTLTPKNFAVESSLVDASGKPLSDHEPVSATFDAE